MLGFFEGRHCCETTTSASGEAEWTHDRLRSRAVRAREHQPKFRQPRREARPVLRRRQGPSSPCSSGSWCCAHLGHGWWGARGGGGWNACIIAHGMHFYDHGSLCALPMHLEVILLPRSSRRRSNPTPALSPKTPGGVKTWREFPFVLKTGMEN